MVIANLNATTKDELRLKGNDEVWAQHFNPTNLHTFLEHAKGAQFLMMHNFLHMEDKFTIGHQRGRKYQRLKENMQAKTRWHVLDIEVVSVIEDFLKEPKFKTMQELIDHLVAKGLISFIIKSSTSRIESGGVKFKFHIYFMTDKAYTPDEIKAYILTHLCDPEDLVEGLTTNGSRRKVVTWLDIAVYNPSRILYELNWDDAEIIGDGQPILIPEGVTNHRWLPIYSDEEYARRRGIEVAQIAHVQGLTTEEAEAEFDRRQTATTIAKNDVVYTTDGTPITVKKFMKTGMTRLKGFDNGSKYDDAWAYYPKTQTFYDFHTNRSLKIVKKHPKKPKSNEVILQEGEYLQLSMLKGHISAKKGNNQVLIGTTGIGKTTTLIEYGISKGQNVILTLPTIAMAQAAEKTFKERYGDKYSAWCITSDEDNKADHRMVYNMLNKPLPDVVFCTWNQLFFIIKKRGKKFFTIFDEAHMLKGVTDEAVKVAIDLHNRSRAFVFTTGTARPEWFGEGVKYLIARRPMTIYGRPHDEKTLFKVPKGSTATVLFNDKVALKKILKAHMLYSGIKNPKLDEYHRYIAMTSTFTAGVNMTAAVEDVHMYTASVDTMSGNRDAATIMQTLSRFRDVKGKIYVYGLITANRNIWFRPDNKKNVVLRECGYNYYNRTSDIVKINDEPLKYDRITGVLSEFELIMYRMRKVGFYLDDMAEVVFEEYETAVKGRLGLLELIPEDEYILPKSYEFTYGKVHCQYGWHLPWEDNPKVKELLKGTKLIAGLSEDSMQPFKNEFFVRLDEFRDLISEDEYAKRKAQKDEMEARGQKWFGKLFKVEREHLTLEERDVNDKYMGETYLDQFENIFEGLVYEKPDYIFRRILKLGAHGGYHQFTDYVWYFVRRELGLPKRNVQCDDKAKLMAAIAKYLEYQNDDRLQMQSRNHAYRIALFKRGFDERFWRSADAKRKARQRFIKKFGDATWAEVQFTGYWENAHAFRFWKRDHVK